ncbi:MAG: hydantoinase B/oxoprolinase family protein, partial [Thermodesulfatator sp.]
FSSNIKERRDFSCAIFNASGQLLAQAAHIPVHLGAMPDTVAQVSKKFSLEPGDIVITNDPFAGGTHLPDITLVSGVFSQASGDLLFYLVARAHHADVGAHVPGSMAIATSLEDEGVLIRPCLFARRGHVLEDYLQEIISRMRGSRERAGDLRAQVACLLRGETRLLEMVARYGEKEFSALVPHLISYGRRFMSSTISEIPDGSYCFEDFLDDDGLGSGPVPIAVRIDIRGDEAHVDFTGTASQLPTSLNATSSVTRSAVYYCFFCLVGEGYPVNAGSLSPVNITIPRGCLLNPAPPAPVAAGNVETSQRIVDVVLGALSRALPERIPAASCGTMNNISIGSTGKGSREFTYYETIGGGMGARPGKDGLSGVQVHMTNTLNTPIEALEQTYPMMLEQYSLRRDSGGRGRFRGGDGIIRRYRFLEPCKVSLLTERRKFSPYGLYGGQDAETGENILYKKGMGTGQLLPGKCVIKVDCGDVLEIRTPGGGGLGKIEP